MANEEGLKILLKGEVQDFLKDMKAGKAAIVDVASSVSSAVKSFLGLSSAADEASKSTEDLSKSLKDEANAANQAGQATSSVGKFIRQMTYERKAALIEMRNGTNGWKLEAKAVQDSVKPLQNAQKQTINTRAAMVGLNNIVRDAPYGFNAVANNITQFTDALFGASLAASAATFGISLLVTAGVTLAQKYGSLSNAFDALTGNIDYQKKLQKELNDELLKGRQAAQDEIISAQRLFNVAKNTTLSLEDRRKAIRALRDEYPGYLKNVSDEELLAGKASTAYDKLKNSLLASARARAIATKAAENAAKDLELEEKGLQIADQLAKINEELAQRQKLQKQLAGTPGSQGTGRDAILAVQQAQLERQINDIFKERTAINQQNLQLEQKLGNTAAGIDPPKGSVKDVKTISDILKELDQQITAINTKFAATGGTAKQIGTELQNAYEKALEALSKLGVSTDSTIFNNIKSEIERIQKFVQNPSFQVAPIRVPIQVAVQPLPPTKLTNIKGLADSFKPMLNELTKELNKIIESALEGLVFNVSDAVGKSLITGDFSGIFKAFGDTIGNFLQEMGKALIATGIGLEAFKKSLQSFNGIGAVIAGGALVAAGAAFKAIVGSGVPAFATGGTVSGPTLAMVGDNPSGVEHIIPQEVLDRLGGASGGYVAEARISGTDLLILMKQADNNQRR